MAFAQNKSLYIGQATRDGQLVYTERHEVEENAQGEVVKALTTYVDPNGKTLATLSSDFSQSVSNATHETHDLQHNRRYGVKWSEGKSYMWNLEDGKEETKEITRNYAKGKLIVGGQGLHYYMRKRLDEFKKKEVPIAILIPGQLDYYSFLVSYAGEENGLSKYVMKAQSRLLRLFAPKLEVWYSPDGKLQRYRGLSNIPDAKGGKQSVEITYQYP
jgi:hypothetical protein